MKSPPRAAHGGPHAPAPKRGVWLLISMLGLATLLVTARRALLATTVSGPVTVATWAVGRHGARSAAADGADTAMQLCPSPDAEACHCDSENGAGQRGLTHRRRPRRSDNAGQVNRIGDVDGTDHDSRRRPPTQRSDAHARAGKADSVFMAGLELDDNDDDDASPHVGAVEPGGLDGTAVSPAEERQASYAVKRAGVYVKQQPRGVAPSAETMNGARNPRAGAARDARSLAGHAHRPTSEASASTLAPASLQAFPTVLVLSPVKNAVAHLGRFFSLLRALDYPRSRISVALLDSDSDDVPTAADLAALQASTHRRVRRIVAGAAARSRRDVGNSSSDSSTAAASGETVDVNPARRHASGRAGLGTGFFEYNAARPRLTGTLALMLRELPLLEAEFSRVTILQHDFGMSLSRASRHAQDVQLARRAVLARSRNHLLYSALRDEEWVLWCVEATPTALCCVRARDRRRTSCSHTHPLTPAAAAPCAQDRLGSRLVPSTRAVDAARSRSPHRGGERGHVSRRSIVRP